MAYLEERYKVPAEAVGTHAELAGVASACPGKNFPEEQIFGSKHLALRVKRCSRGGDNHPTFPRKGRVFCSYVP